MSEPEKTAVAPGALLAVLPEAISSAAQKAIANFPQLFGVDEKSVITLMKQENHAPTPTDYRLRMKFWAEYDRVQVNGGTIDPVNIYAGACGRSTFYKYLENAHKVAFMLTPPASYEVLASEALQFGLEKMREILDFPDTEPNGKVNVKLLGLKLQIVTMLDQRIKGGFVQKTLNLTADARQVGKAVEQESMEALDAKLKELDRKQQKLLSATKR